MNYPMNACGNDLRLADGHSGQNSISQIRRFAGLGILALLMMFGIANTASAQVTTISATSLKGIKIARGPDVTVTSSTDWVNLPGASLSFTLAPGASYLFVARYTAESACYGTPAGWCSVRVLMNGTEASPAVGLNFAFDSTDAGAASSSGWKGHAVDRSLHYTNTSTKPLTLTAVVQYSVTDPSITFWLDDWQFTVEQFQ